ncbi:TatD family hydrolase [Chitinivorax sp. PXF-14]|uniref:TatD family hydrolase n=1 Tax=Chitinivorax sp. PXF-14 TaxID=3230488 RepID=UPI003465DEBE
MLIDTHCHLDAAEFDADRDDVAARARALGVARIVVPAVGRFNFGSTCRMRTLYGCDIALGLHPIYVGQHRDEDLPALRKLSEDVRPVAIGEIGLDGFVPGLDMARQEWLFVEQLKIAQTLDLPVLLHIRRAQDQILKYLRRYRVKGGVAHAFNGSHQQADEFIKLGFRLGFGGAMTFERALRIRELAANLPLDSIVLETDAPDIAPAWAYRQRNTPEYLPHIAEVLGGLRGQSQAAVARATTANAAATLGLTL